MIGMQGAISTRCEQLLAAASLRSFHKEAIKVEQVAPAAGLKEQQGSGGADTTLVPSPCDSGPNKRKASDLP